MAIADKNDTDKHDALPDYAAELDAYHRARAGELQRIIAELPLSPGDKVLDMACGDGVYSGWLARQVGAAGLVVGADLSLEYLQIAADGAAKPAWIVAAVGSLPFADGAFDAAWCAQSLVSLPEPEVALRELCRVVRAGGLVAVMENDSLHQALLPWPAELELAVRRAELRAHQSKARRPDKRYIARQLCELFHDAGLESVRRKTYCTDRQWQLGDAEAEYLERYFARLTELVQPHLAESDRNELARLTDPASPDYMPKQRSFAMTWLDVVCTGQKVRR